MQRPRHPALTPAVPAARAEPRRDLGNELTVFVTSVGASTLASCLSHLERQDVGFRLEVIRDVTPASRAFQLMVDRCETPAYVQVDEDMLLIPSAVSTLHAALTRAPADVAVVIGRLYDPHLGRSIEGVKIFRRHVSAAFPWVATPSVQERWARMLNAGWRIRRLPASGRWAVPPLGVHAPSWTPRAIYGRYRVLQRMTRAYPQDMDWFERYGLVFAKRFAERRDTLSFFALMGVVSGTVVALGRDPGEHDDVELRALPEFARLWEYWLSIAPPGEQPGGPDDPISILTTDVDDHSTPR